ncbi:MAG: glycosyltransferase [Collinsella sp.]
MPALSDELVRLLDSRVKVVTLTENKGIAENTNAGIEAASGDYIVFFDHDDTLDRFALYRYAEQISAHFDTDALYCDEDFLNEAGDYVDPHYKSDFNLDLLRVHNYITHLLFAFVPRWLKS